MDDGIKAALTVVAVIVILVFMFSSSKPSQRSRTEKGGSNAVPKNSGSPTDRLDDLSDCPNQKLDSLWHKNMDAANKHLKKGNSEKHQEHLDQAQRLQAELSRRRKLTNIQRAISTAFEEKDDISQETIHTIAFEISKSFPDFSSTLLKFQAIHKCDQAEAWRIIVYGIRERSKDNISIKESVHSVFKK